MGGTVRAKNIASGLQRSAQRNKNGAQLTRVMNTRFVSTDQTSLISISTCAPQRRHFGFGGCDNITEQFVPPQPTCALQNSSSNPDGLDRSNEEEYSKNGREINGAEYEKSNDAECKSNDADSASMNKSRRIINPMDNESQNGNTERDNTCQNSIRVVTDAREAQDLALRLMATEEAVGVDCEGVSLSRFGRLCLLQIADSKGKVVVFLVEYCLLQNCRYYASISGYGGVFLILLRNPCLLAYGKFVIGN